MRSGIFALWLVLLPVCRPTAAAEAVPQPVGWYEVSVPGVSVTRPAIQRSRDTLSRLPIRLVGLEEFSKYLKKLDQQSGVLEQAGELLKKGKELHLGLKLSRAEDLYRQAIAKLDGSFARYYQPELLAEPVLQLGVAQFQAGRKDQARRAFMRAIGLSPGLKLAEGYYSPSVRSAFEEARRELGKLEVELPPPGEMDRICKAALLRAMVVLSVERLGDRPLLRLSLFDPGSGKYTAVETTVIEEKNAAEAGQQVAERLSGKLAAAVGISYQAKPEVPDGGVGLPDGGVETGETPDPWYVRHWWIWPVTAAVIAGVAVTLPLTVFREDVVDVRVRY